MFHPDEDTNDPTTWKTAAWEFDHPTSYKDEEIVLYYVWQFERTQSGRIHVQGFCKLTRKLRLKQVKEMFGNNTMHIEERYSTDQDAANYCKKVESRLDPNALPVEWGNIQEHGQGKRTDIKKCYLDIKNGMPVDEVLDNHTDIYFKYSRTVNRLVQDVHRKRLRDDEVFRDVDVRVFWGVPGAGKTRRVYEEVKRDYGTYNVMFKLPNSKPLWFNTYRGQPVMFIDDFGRDWTTDGIMTKGFLLNLLDRYPLSLNVKGEDPVEANWTRVYITSNEPPCEWYKTGNRAENIMIAAAIERRISLCEHMIG